MRPAERAPKLSPAMRQVIDRLKEGWTLHAFRTYQGQMQAFMALPSTSATATVRPATVRALYARGLLTRESNGRDGYKYLLAKGGRDV